MLKFEILDQKIVSFRSTEKARLSEDHRALFTDGATIKLTTPSKHTVLRGRKPLPLVVADAGHVSCGVALHDGTYCLLGHGRRVKLFDCGVAKCYYRSILGIDFVSEFGGMTPDDEDCHLLQLSADLISGSVAVHLPDKIGNQLELCCLSVGENGGDAIYWSKQTIGWYVKVRRLGNTNERTATLYTHRTDYRRLSFELVDYLFEHGMETFRDEPQAVEKCQIA